MKQLRILIIGSCAPGSLENSYAKSLNRLNATPAIHFDVHKYHEKFACCKGMRRIMSNRYTYPLFAKYIGKKLIDFFTAVDQSFDAVLVFKGMEFSSEILKTCRRMQPEAIWININPDDPFNTASVASSNRNVVDALSFYDIYCIWSRALTKKLKEHGCKRVEYLPFGYDPDSHIPPSGQIPIKPGVISFVGAWDPQREATLTALAGHDLLICGSGWNRIAKKSPLRNKIVPRNIYGKELAELIYSSTLCLNLLRPQNAGAHNMRTFEIPAMGGLMLTTRSREQDEFLPEYEGCLMFSDIHELQERAVEAIDNKELARQIRQTGSQLIYENSYINRAETLLTFIS